MTERCRRLTEAMAQKGLRAAWIVKPENMRYLTGYTGEGALFVSEERCVILTDFRYTEQASRQAPESECLRTTREVSEKELVARLLGEVGEKRCGFEPEQVTVEAFRKMCDAAPGAEFLPMEGMIESLRVVKDESEIACIEKASAIACEAFERLLKWVKPGMTEKQVQLRLDYDMFELGSEKNAFDTIACAGVNGSLPHAIPSDHALQKGELLTLDFGAQSGGYKSDMTRTIAIGDVSDELKAIYDTVLTAQTMALDAVRPGACCSDIDKIARDYIDARYPGAFGHSLGHGVGLLIHEAPGFSPSCDVTLVPGHVVTVEPGVYIPGLGGCRIEDMVIITKDGFVNPITAPKQLITV
jgi:Xaa-Pro aminopeptidase